MEFGFLNYLANLIYPEYNSYCFIFYMIIRYCLILKQHQISILKPVSSQLLRDLLKEDEIDDVNNVIVLNSSSNVRSSIKIAVAERIKRKVFIVNKKLDATESIGLLSHVLHCNLKEVIRCCFKNCNKKSVKFADEVELSLISSTNELSQFVIDQCLKNYFKTPKLVAVEDIIEVDFEQYGKELFYSSGKIPYIQEKIYFKCNKIMYNNVNISSDALFCVSDKSDLKQSVNVQSFIPKKLYKFKADLLSLPFPEALNNYFEDIRKAVQFFMNKSDNINFTPIFLIEGRKGSGKHLLIQCIADYFGMHLYSVNNMDITANVYAQNETKLRNIFFSAKMAAPSILEINNFENFGKNNEGQYDERLSTHFITELPKFFKNNLLPALIFCSSNEKNITTELKRVFLKKFEIKPPNEQERESMLRWILKRHNIETDFNLKNIANKTHGFILNDLKALVDYTVMDYCINNNSVLKNIPEEYFLKALDFMHSRYNESLGAPKVPKVKWSDVGGLTEVKEEIINTIKLPLKHPELLKNTGLKRSGILLFGPPGTGKTLIAKAVATECGLCFLSVKGPELLNMYVGQSEQNVREVFERGREASPCIIFFDELDSLAPNRGAAGDSGGVMDRVVSQLLAEMDGLNKTEDVFIIGATNRPDLIDPALLRPGRFDKLLYVGPCTDFESKIAVLTALTKRFKLADKSVIEHVVRLCPENISGADFYGLCSHAWMSAVRRLISTIESVNREKDSYATLNDVVVTLDDFKSAIKNIKPSIKQEDLEYFHKLKAELT